MPVDWEAVKEKLIRDHQRVDLVCDGYNVTLKVQRISALKLGIVVYVNGQLDHNWLIAEPTEEGKRFYPLHVHYCYSKEIRMRYKKIPKKRQDKTGFDINRQWESRSFYWGSFLRLKAHFVRNNTSIEEKKD